MSQTTGPPVGACTIVPAPFSRTTAPKRSAHSRAASSRWASTQAESRSSRRASSPACGVSTVGWARVERLEAEEGVGIDDDGKLEALEQSRHERVRLGAAAEPRPERDGVGALRLGHDRLLGVAPSRSRA